MAELIWVTKDAAVNPAQIGFVRYESGAFIVTLSGGATHKFHEQSLTEAGRHLFADGPADHRASSSRLSTGEEAKRP
jgi:hypothetical protein